jgi:SPP1 gp7 family putative phage head morphogenesis protein
MAKSSYWVDRLDEQNFRLLDKTEAEIMAQVVKLYRHTMKQLEGEIKQLYADIQTNKANGIVSIADLYQYDRYYKIGSELNNRLYTLGDSCCSVFESKFVDLYKDTQELLKNANKDLFDTPEGFVRDPKVIVNEIWTSDGKNWKARVWKNTTGLEEKVMDALTDCFVRGVAVNRVVASIDEAFHSGIYAAQRLIRTELSRIQNRALLEEYIAHGVNYYKIVGANDDRTCPICAEQIGKIYNIMDAVTGINMPPFHPNGRCSIVPVLKGVNDNV